MCGTNGGLFQPAVSEFQPELFVLSQGQLLLVNCRVAKATPSLIPADRCAAEAAVQSCAAPQTYRAYPHAIATLIGNFSRPLPLGQKHKVFAVDLIGKVFG